MTRDPDWSVDPTDGMLVFRGVKARGWVEIGRSEIGGKTIISRTPDWPEELRPAIKESQMKKTAKPMSRILAQVWLEICEAGAKPKGRHTTKKT